MPSETYNFEDFDYPFYSLIRRAGKPYFYLSVGKTTPSSLQSEKKDNRLWPPKYSS